jgi:hypothetical protein
VSVKSFEEVTGWGVGAGKVLLSEVARGRGGGGGGLSEVARGRGGGGGGVSSLGRRFTLPMMSGKREMRVKDVFVERIEAHQFRSLK